ncbi:winged helix-turn-helix transcriptional regulator [bacterium]|nr:winged helix-turn-helix transcriptional regulator [Balneola sp.]MBR9916263.1 winged helix-turn-helix transcriptional regulator [bacterium]
MNKLFKALNDSTRRQILDLLKEKDLTAGEIAEAFDISKPSISHHLDLLKNAGLVSSERDGQFIVYSLDTTALEEATQWLFKLMNSN